ncbi:MAG: T9SS type A sorting domain-containing protein [Bacteroidota bacterium]
MRSQIILNGNFLLGTTAWGCGVETNAETVYGGTNGLNTVAEVDAAAGLCQTVLGLTIGNVYRLSFDCSRRVGGCPSPNPTNIIVTVSGGVLTKIESRSNASFALTTTAYLFTATANSHVITFSPGSGFAGSTCGMIIDNIAVSFSPLPIELLYFDASVLNDESVKTEWETATELNNDFFTVERSTNSLDWQEIATQNGGGTTTQRIKYSYIDHSPFEGVSYYRLKQTDFNGAFKHSSISSVEIQKGSAISVFPNPSASHVLNIQTKESLPYTIGVYDQLGRELMLSSYHITTQINLEQLDAGIYHLVISKQDRILYQNKVVLQ